jgi:hypothetical protein
MVPDTSLLVCLVQLIDRIPLPPQPARHGHPPVYSDRLFLQALVIMIVRHLPTVHALLAVWDQPTPEMQALRALLQEQGRYPARRTWERRLKAIPTTLPAQIGCLGRYVVALIDPWQQDGHAAAIDSTPLRARGGVWHQQERKAGTVPVPHTSLDTEAHWTKSGWHGWVYGWKLHLITTVATVWIPLAAALTPANAADNEQAPALLAELPPLVRFVLGDQHYNDPALREQGGANGRVLVTTKRGAYPHHDDGGEVRRIFHALRSRAIETCNGPFKAIFDCGGHVPTRGLIATRRCVLGAVLVYQLALLQRFETGESLRVGLKPFLKAA